MRVAEPLFEIHVEVTVAVRTASCLAWISSQSLIIWRIWRVNVERSRRNIFEINRLAPAARSRGVENLVRCVRTIVVAINMLAVIIQLPRGFHDLVIKTIILRVARSGVWAAIAHHGIVLPFEWPVVAPNIAFLFEKYEQNLWVYVVLLRGVINNLRSGNHSVFNLAF